MGRLELVLCELRQQATLANAAVAYDDVLEQNVVVELLLLGCHGACLCALVLFFVLLFFCRFASFGIYLEIQSVLL